MDKETLFRKDYEEVEHRLRHRFGFMILKPDAIELDIFEYLIYIVTSRMLPKANLDSMILLEPISQEDLGYMYPQLEERYFWGHCISFQKPSILLIYRGQGSETDLWRELKDIRGKIHPRNRQLFGIKDSVRGIIPLPGDIQTFVEVTERIQLGTVTRNDHIWMSRNLAHVPENLTEVAGVLRLLSHEQLQTISLEPEMINQYIMYAKPRKIEKQKDE